MPTLPNAIVPVLNSFATLFRRPTWLKAQILLVGAILATGQRTAASAFRVTGISDDRNCARYHEVPKRDLALPRQLRNLDSFDFQLNDAAGHWAGCCCFAFWMPLIDSN